MKVAVTGAAGFIGRHVVAELGRRSIQPTAVILPGSEKPDFLRQARVVELDLTVGSGDSFSLLGEPDVLIHLAWSGLPNYASLHHFESLLPAHFAFLKELVGSGLSNLTVAGTCFEYGMQSGQLSEDASATAVTAYGFAKNALRMELEFLRQRTPFNLTWARIFYLFGDGQSATSLYGQLRAAMERGDKTFDMSGGEQLRDFLPVEEAARSLVALALLRRDAGIVNVCSGNPVSVRKKAEDWVAEAGSAIDLNFGHYPYAGFEPMEFWGDRSKLEALLA